MGRKVDLRLSDAQSAEERHERIKYALKTIQKAFFEASQIPVSERFALTLDISNENGFPSLQLALRDKEKNDRVRLFLKSTTCDDRGLGNIELRLFSGELTGSFQLCDPEEAYRIPLVLKRSLRIFFDDVTTFLSDPKALLEEDALVDAQREATDSIAETLGKVDVYEEGREESDNKVAHCGEIRPLEIN